MPVRNVSPQRRPVRRSSSSRIRLTPSRVVGLVVLVLGLIFLISFLVVTL